MTSIERTIAALILLLGIGWSGSDAASAAPPRFEPLQEQSGIDLFVWKDVCNVYVLRDGEAAMMIDLGDGSVLEHLGEIGVRRLEWVLLTHHHREQCQGHPKLKEWKAQVAAPEAERALLERPADFRKMKPSLGDRYSVHGASYVRPPVEPLKVDRGFQARDTFTWRGHEFWCVETAGNSPGSMSYLLRTGEGTTVASGRGQSHFRSGENWDSPPLTPSPVLKTGRGWLAFSGDVMCAGAKMHNWFDTEWDYGFAKGLYTLVGAANLLENVEPALLLPAHGPVIPRPKTELHEYQQKLRRLAKLLVRGYTVDTFGAADTDNTSRPSPVPHLWQTTEHLYKFRGPGHGPNCTFLLAKSGRALMVDCGLIAQPQLDAVLAQMQERLGLKAIDAVLVTHMHGDHVMGAPHLREKWGTKLWTLDRVAPPVEQPHRFDYSAQPWSYSAQAGPIQFDRLFKPGEKVQWEGYELQIDWMPGQTEFACCIHGMIDGRRVAFTGDNLFGNAADPEQTGHEAVVARNSAILEEGYIYGSDYLRRLRPDLIVAGHSFVMDRPQGLCERFHRWSLAMRDAFREVSGEDDYRYTFDPYWVRADPYRVQVSRGGRAEATLCVRNFLARPQPYRIIPHAPEGITAAPAVLEGVVPAEDTLCLPMKLLARGDMKPGVYLVGLDTTRDGQRYGEWFDLIVGVSSR